MTALSGQLLLPQICLHTKQPNLFSKSKTCVWSTRFGFEIMLLPKANAEAERPSKPRSLEDGRKRTSSACSIHFDLVMERIWKNESQICFFAGPLQCAAFLRWGLQDLPLTKPVLSINPTSHNLTCEAAALRLKNFIVKGLVQGHPSEMFKFSRQSFLLNELLAVFRNHFSGAQLRTFQHPSRPKDLFSSEPRPVLHRSVCPQHVATLMPHQILLALYPLARIVSCLQLGTTELILVTYSGESSRSTQFKFWWKSMSFAPCPATGRCDSRAWDMPRCSQSISSRTLLSNIYLWNMQLQKMPTGARTVFCPCASPRTCW